MKRKYFTYILLVVVSLFMFDSRVEASKKDGYGVTCDEMDLNNGYKIFDPKKYDVSCVYKLDVSSGYDVDTSDGWWPWDWKFNEKNNCIVVQIAYNNDAKSDSKVKFDALSNHWNYDGVKLDIISNIKKNEVGTSCPSYLYFDNYEIKMTKDSSGQLMLPVSSFSSGKIIEPKKIGSNDAKFGDFGDFDCAEALGDELIGYLQLIVNVVKVAVPILVIVFGMLDFAKAIFSSDEGEMKKAQSKFIRRLIIGVAFFLIPTFLGLLLDIAHKIWPIIDNTLCGIDF